MRTALSYDSMFKSSVLQTSGWFGDTAGQMESTNASNNGFDERRAWFLNPPTEVDAKYTPNKETKVLAGRLMTSMSGASAPCPPGMKI